MTSKHSIQLSNLSLFQPFLVSDMADYQEQILKNSPSVLVYEFKGTAQPIFYIPNGCFDFLFYLDKYSCTPIQPLISPADFITSYNSSYFGIHFEPGILPSRYFNSSFYISLFSEQRNFSSRISCFQQYFNAEKEIQPYSEAVKYMLYRMKEQKGVISIQQLAQELSYSERHTHRLFQTHMGYSPKLYSRIVRFQSALWEMLHFPERNISAFIENLGYSDQAHFQREFKEFTRMTPKQFLKYFQSHGLL